MQHSTAPASACGVSTAYAGSATCSRHSLYGSLHYFILSQVESQEEHQGTTLGIVMRMLAVVAAEMQCMCLSRPVRPHVLPAGHALSPEDCTHEGELLAYSH